MKPLLVDLRVSKVHSVLLVVMALALMAVIITSTHVLWLQWLLCTLVMVTTAVYWYRTVFKRQGICQIRYDASNWYIKTLTRWYTFELRHCHHNFSSLIIISGYLLDDGERQQSVVVPVFVDSTTRACYRGLIARLRFAA